MDNTFHSLEWMHALRDAEIPEALKLLGYVMMAYAKREGLTQPSVSQLMLATPKSLEDDDSVPVSRRTLQRRRAKLVKLGWIRLVKKGDGRGKTSIYALTFPPGNRVWGTSETASETASEDLRETASGQAHLERLLERSTRTSSRAEENGTGNPPTIEQLQAEGLIPDW